MTSVGVADITGASTLQESDLVRQGRPRWEELETILADADRQGLTRLSPDAVLRLGTLYRAASADLARARAAGEAPAVCDYLNGLVARGHGVVYVKKTRRLHAIRDFYAVTFPRLVRATQWYLWMATLAFLGTGVLAAVLVYYQPEFRDLLIPDGYHRMADELKEREDWVDVDPAFAPQMSSMILTNNIRVSIMAFAGGVFAGVGSLLMLVFNGVVLGGLTGFVHLQEGEMVLWSFVVAHGVIELPAICIAGGAGFLMGSALIAPGEFSRREALRLRARIAGQLIAGVAGLLVVAGLIEGFFSPLKIPYFVKFAFAIVPATGLFLYFIKGRHHPDEQTLRRQLIFGLPGTNR